MQAIHDGFSKAAVPGLRRQIPRNRGKDRIDDALAARRVQRSRWRDRNAGDEQKGGESLRLRMDQVSFFGLWGSLAIASDRRKRRSPALSS